MSVVGQDCLCVVCIMVCPGDVDVIVWCEGLKGLGDTVIIAAKVRLFHLNGVVSVIAGRLVGLVLR